MPAETDFDGVGRLADFLGEGGGSSTPPAGLYMTNSHLVETFEFFYTLRKNNWDGVWQLDQFPFREDSVEAAKVAIRFLKALHGALDALDEEALREAQSSHDALAAQRLVQDVLLSSMARTTASQDVNA